MDFYGRPAWQMWALYFCPVSFFFPRLISAVADWMHTIPYCDTTLCGHSANLECRSEMCYMRLAEIQHAKRTQKLAICAPSHNFVGLYLRIEGIYRQSEKFLNSIISSTYPHNMVNVGPLTVETGWRVWGTPANFNGVRVLTSLLQRRRSTEVHQTLHDVWPYAGMVYYIYIFGGSCPLRNPARCKIHFASKCCVLLFWQRYCTALEQWASAKLCGMVQGMELWNCRSSSFSTEGATYIPRAAVTLGIGPHSSLGYCVPAGNFVLLGVTYFSICLLQPWHLCDEKISL